MNGRRIAKPAFTLIELLVVVSIIALLISILLPALGRAREQVRSATCGRNLKTVGVAYQMWAGDHGNFLPPRCPSNMGCDAREVEAGWSAQPGVTLKRTFYYDGHSSIHHDMTGIVGQCTRKPGSTDPHDPGSYNDTNSYPLNRYIVPNWKFDLPMEIAHCPSDIRSLKSQDNDVDGIPEGSIASAFDIHGTSYVTNILSIAWWRGHGPWAKLIEGVLNRMAGPNYVSERIYGPSRYVVMLDMANFYENFSAFIGPKSGVGRWHEASLDDKWEKANALFLDNHVSAGKYDIPASGIGISSLNPYVNATWSLYPYKRKKTAFMGGS